MERDFSFLFADAVTFEQISESAQKLHLSALVSFEPAEIFRGGNVPPGKYSILLRAVFQSGERTLREDEVAQWSAQMIKAFESLGWRVESLSFHSVWHRLSYVARTLLSA